MKAFMAAVLLGAAGLDELGPDAELDPPDGELGEAGDGGAREWIAVVRPDALRQAVLAEEMAKNA